MWGVYHLRACLFSVEIMYKLLTQYCAGGKVEKNEMGGSCGAYGGGEKWAQDSGGETWEKETTEETQTYMGG
jgi:hypothetical protein